MYRFWIFRALARANFGINCDIAREKILIFWRMHGRVL